MQVIFFKENISFVSNYLTRNFDSVAFWYIPGLNSYKYLPDTISISSILIEENLLVSFKKDFPELAESNDIHVFPTTSIVKGKGLIAFLASNDTITNSFYNIIKQVELPEYELFCKPKENAKGAADSLALKSKTVGLVLPQIDKYNLLVVCNDWGLTERKISQDFYARRKNVICLQESSIDFNEQDKRMRYCSIPIFQGVASLSHFDIRGKICAVIGNPRFEKLAKTPLPGFNKALINVNFTYGMFEEAREQWVRDILLSCDETNFDYAISQHPRDRGDFTGYNLLKSNSTSVHQSIEDCSVVISRFSALLTESICLGRPAIYYNPHGEDIKYRFDPDNKMFFYATNIVELKSALSSIKALNSKGDNDDVMFLQKHLGVTSNGDASAYIAKFIVDALSYPPVRKSNWFERVKIFLTIGKRILRNQNY